jgi:hypothetical protein
MNVLPFTNPVMRGKVTYTRKWVRMLMDPSAEGTLLLQAACSPASLMGKILHVSIDRHDDERSLADLQNQQNAPSSSKRGYFCTVASRLSPGSGDLSGCRSSTACILRGAARKMSRCERDFVSDGDGVPTVHRRRNDIVDYDIS